MRRLHEQRGTFNFGKFRSQSVNDLRGGELALIAWFEDDEATSGVGCLGTASAASKRCHCCDIRILQDHIAHLAQQLHHLLWGGILRRLGKCRNHSGILDREEAFGNSNEHDRRQCDGGEENAERDRLMAQHDVKRAPVEGQHGIEPGLDDPKDGTVPARFAMHKA